MLDMSAVIRAQTVHTSRAMKDLPLTIQNPIIMESQALAIEAMARQPLKEILTETAYLTAMIPTMITTEKATIKNNMTTLSRHVQWNLKFNKKAFVISVISIVFITAWICLQLYNIFLNRHVSSDETDAQYDSQPKDF